MPATNPFTSCATKNIPSGLNFPEKLSVFSPATSAASKTRFSFTPTLSPRSSLTKTIRPKSKSLQPCRCSFAGCGKTFSKRSNLKAHLRVHSGVLPYPCEFQGCNKRFRWKSSLKPHVKVHLAAGHSPKSDFSPLAPSLVASKNYVGSSANTNPAISVQHPKHSNIHFSSSRNETNSRFCSSDLVPSQNSTKSNSLSTKSFSAAQTCDHAQQALAVFNMKNVQKSNFQHWHFDLSSPTTVSQSSLFESPLTMDRPSEIRKQPNLSNVQQNMSSKFHPRYAESTNNAPDSGQNQMISLCPQSKTKHLENRPLAPRVLFPEESKTHPGNNAYSSEFMGFEIVYNNPVASSSSKNPLFEVEDTDLSCDSVLSSSQCSEESSMKSFGFNSNPKAEDDIIPDDGWTNSLSFGDEFSYLSEFDFLVCPPMQRESPQSTAESVSFPFRM